jgi:hypothetical protein
MDLLFSGIWIMENTGLPLRFPDSTKRKFTVVIVLKKKEIHYAAFCYCTNHIDNDALETKKETCILEFYKVERS